VTIANVEVVRRLFQAVEARDITPMYEIYSPEVVIREAGSLPYGGEHVGHAGMLDHGLGFVETWDHLQDDEDRRLDAEFVDAGDRVFVSWRHRAHGRDGSKIDLPVVAVYEVREQRVVQATMHHLDTAALLDFLDHQRDLTSTDDQARESDQTRGDGTP
jgi:ketosteroid isomerase-like protein